MRLRMVGKVLDSLEFIEALYAVYSLQEGAEVLRICAHHNRTADPHIPIKSQLHQSGLAAGKQYTKQHGSYFLTRAESPIKQKTPATWFRVGYRTIIEFDIIPHR